MEKTKNNKLISSMMLCGVALSLGLSANSINHSSQAFADSNSASSVTPKTTADSSNYVTVNGTVHYVNADTGKEIASAEMHVTIPKGDTASLDASKILEKGMTLADNNESLQLSGKTTDYTIKVKVDKDASIKKNAPEITQDDVKLSSTLNARAAQPMMLAVTSTASNPDNESLADANADKAGADANSASSSSSDAKSSEANSSSDAKASSSSLAKDATTSDSNSDKGGGAVSSSDAGKADAKSDATSRTSASDKSSTSTSSNADNSSDKSIAGISTSSSTDLTKAGMTPDNASTSSNSAENGNSSTSSNSNTSEANNDSTTSSSTANDSDDATSGNDTSLSQSSSSVANSSSSANSSSANDNSASGDNGNGTSTGTDNGNGDAENPANSGSTDNGEAADDTYSPQKAAMLAKTNAKAQQSGIIAAIGAAMGVVVGLFGLKKKSE